MGTAMYHPVPDRVKPLFVIFDIRALLRSGTYSGRQRVDLCYKATPAVVKFCVDLAMFCVFLEQNNKLGLLGSEHYYY